ncbi:3-oxoacyl-ACP reductase [Prosthecomicrobium hirschii]|uniref:3-oxoacyl-ACP reductase n=1 Tax=Prosthecodimorpha hirschii TaxID=665126 RepID=A0A0P6W4I8_9HYPH|nr:SDR family NAD(P)-dependent oxidoreductase [Prosthecomicrobium hirschii]KPL54154.1 3-oxoacyl-ACP reductase [Prosthecomicrobium hirschii]
MSRDAQTGRAAIVTGGARGIGLAIARRLAADGWRLALWDRDAAGAIAAASALGPHHLGLPHLGLGCDIADEASVAAAADATWAAFGTVRGLVNNAGILGPVAPLWLQPPAEFRRVIDVNLTGTFLVLAACVPRMLEAVGPDRGRIVNVSSIQAKEGMPNAGAYAASKAGIVAMTKSLGKELATHGILVNCITPAAAETDMAKEITPARKAEILARIPMGRFVGVDEIAAMTGWLLSDDCSYSTGAVFDLSGGRATY